MAQENETGAAKRPLVLSKPAKPVEDMTEQELDEFAAALYDRIRRGIAPKN